MAVVVTLALPLVATGPASGERRRPPVVPLAGAGPELVETNRLADRRFVVSGTRFFEFGAQDGSYPAAGWHIRGEMGGFWTPPIKLLDGLWFAVNGHWLTAERFVAGQGYSRMDLSGAPGVDVHRVDIVPDGGRAGLIGLTLRGTGTVTLAVDAHSELMSAYPWSGTTPAQDRFNLSDAARFDGRNLVFSETGRPPVPGAARHDWAALVGATLDPSSHELGAGFRGRQEPAVVCPGGDPAPRRCDDGPSGRGAGGRLSYRLDLSHGPRTVWFAVAGSDHGVEAARAELARALSRPAALAAGKVAARRAVAARTSVDLPADPLLAQSVEWSKQNLADSVQQADDLRVFASGQGRAYPPPAGTLPRARWIGAGWPDYPWIFGTDGEYTAFAAVAAGLAGPVQDHLRALRAVSDIANGGSGKVVHEVTPDGQVWFGTNDDPGNTDETAKFPSAVALVWRWTGDDRFRDEMYDFTVRNMRYVVGSDADGDGWPEGSGNVERPGMGGEHLDVAVYTIRGLRDLADLAESRGDTATARWANDQAEQRERRFDSTWWHGGDANSYADSLSDPGDTRRFHRHWTGLTPMEAQVVEPGGRRRPVASTGHASVGLPQRERDCYTGEFGLFHTGTGPTTAPGDNRAPSCDSVVSAVPAERSTFSLTTAVMAVAEGNYGRLGEQRAYTTGNARSQLDSAVWEQPGAMPEIAPSPDFGSNLERDFFSRSSVLQAWGAYGVLWPVVHQQLGVDPDLGRRRLSVVPQLPPGAERIAGTAIPLGGDTLDVSATRRSRRLTTTVVLGRPCRLTLGAVLPAGAVVAGVRLDGRPVSYRVVGTARGLEVRVDAGTVRGRHVLAVRLS